MAFDYAAKISALLANAEDETLPEAARASYRAKAEQLMRDYRIAEEDAIATEGTAAVPVSDSIVIMEHNAYFNPLQAHYWGIWSAIADHCGIRTSGVYSGHRYSSDEDDQKLTATAVGYEGDIKYAELLWLAARLVFLTRIDARKDPSLSDAENCYYMRGSGMKRNQIARALWGSADDDGAAHGRVQKLYVAECVKRGETPKVSGRGIQVDVYREAYANGFYNELYWRLRAAASAVAKESGGLVLHGRKERVDEAYYTLFPGHRPMSEEDYAKHAARRAEELANCEDCKKTTSKTGMCKRHRPSEVTAAEKRRQERMYGSAEAHAGMRAGERAAKAVHLSRTGTDAQPAAPAAPTQKELA